MVTGAGSSPEGATGISATIESRASSRRKYRCDRIAISDRRSPVWYRRRAPSTRRSRTRPRTSSGASRSNPRGSARRAPPHRAPRPRHRRARAVRLEIHSLSVDPNESWESRSRLRILRVVTRIWCTASSDVGAHGAIPHQQLVNLLGHRAVYRVSGRLRAVGLRRRAEHPRQLGAVTGGCRTGVEQPIAQPVNSSVSAVPFVADELQFPLAPLLFGGARIGAIGARPPTTR